MRTAIAAACLGASLLLGPGGAEAGTLDTVRRNGELRCGVNTGLVGFSATDSRGAWRGLDVDYCRALAAAALGDPAKVRFVPLSPQQRFPALQSGEIDVLTNNTTWTLAREATAGILFAGVNFYDGQGFMVRASGGVASAKQLDGATVCLQPGTVTELNLGDFARANRIRVNPVPIDSISQAVEAFRAGRCDAYTADASALASIRAGLPNPGEAVVLPEIVSKEPLGPSVRADDAPWFNLARWTHFAMVAAEEFGVTQGNVGEKLRSEDPAVQRLLGVTGNLGRGLGVRDDWAVSVVRAVGNYGESFERNVGRASPLGLPRGVNDLWTRGGLMYAMPVR